jgi:hypothetical protein
LPRASDASGARDEAYGQLHAGGVPQSGPRNALDHGMFIDIGHSHPDFVYPNDQRQVKLALALTTLAAFVICAMIIATLV